MTRVDVVIATRNRREDLRETLGQLRQLSFATALDIVVVDNASSDGTREMVKRDFPNVRVMALLNNGGPVMKNRGVARGENPFVLFLDDDSAPFDGAVERAIGHLMADAKLGCVSFDVVLPNGSHECSAYPGVFIGCGAMFRRSAIEACGGLPEDFFMAAEEYVPSLRMLDAGWKVERKTDCVVSHRKTPASRLGARTLRYDVRNNLMLVWRCFSMKRAAQLSFDWTRRYYWIAQNNNQHVAFWRGFFEGVMRSLAEVFDRKSVVSEEVARAFLMEPQIRRAMEGQSRVIVLGLGKNVGQVMRVCEEMKIEVAAIVDDVFARPRWETSRKYRGVKVVDAKEGIRLVEQGRVTAAMVGHASPVLAQKTKQHWQRLLAIPVLDLFEGSAE